MLLAFGPAAHTLDNDTQNGNDLPPRTKRWVTVLVWSVVLAVDVAALTYLVRTIGDAASPLAANSRVVSDSKFIIERTPDPGPE